MGQGAIQLGEATLPAEGRSINRTNLFLAATLLWAEVGSVPVKVRDLSPTGAMVEGPALPPPGSTVRLARGALAISATVMWNSGARCGIAFGGIVSVKQWMSPPVNGEQQRVDDAISRLRGGALRLAEPARPPAPLSVPAELELVARLVTQLGEALAEDEGVLSRHGLQLQKIDIVLQLLEATASAVAGRPGGGARLADLHASAEQALRSGAI